LTATASGKSFFKQQEVITNLTMKVANASLDLAARQELGGLQH